MRVSVIIPTYNDARTLGRTVRAALAQEHDDLEVIVVNDGGTPSAELAALRDPRLRVIDRPDNRGVSAARNHGMAVASGEILYFLDADDLPAPDLLRFAAGVFADPQAALLVVGHETRPDETIGPGDESRVGARTGRVERLAPVPFFELMRARSGMFIPSVTLLRRRDLVAVLGEEPWCSALTNNHDTLLFLQMASRRDVLLCRDPYVIYRRHPGSMSRNRARAWTARVQAMDILSGFLGERDADPRLRRIARAMRQGGARQAARALGEAGRHAEARRLLADDLRRSPNWKSALMMAARTFSRRA